MHTHTHTYVCVCVYTENTKLRVLEPQSTARYLIMF